jgi:hypothetical protein
MNSFQKAKNGGAYTHQVTHMGKERDVQTSSTLNGMKCSINKAVAEVLLRFNIFVIQQVHYFFKHTCCSLKKSPAGMETRGLTH